MEGLAGRTPNLVLNEHMARARQVIEEAGKTPVTPRKLAEKLGISMGASKNILIRLVATGEFDSAIISGYVIWKK